jgi:hypothetical protein
MRHTRTLAVTLLVVGAAACSQSPTAARPATTPATQLGPSAGPASYDTAPDTTTRSGLGFGSGH